MRKIWVLGILFSAFAITGCFNSGSCVQGYGPVRNIPRLVATFTGVSNTGSFEVRVVQSDTFSVVVEAQENLHPIIETYVSGSTLIVKTKNETCINSVVPAIVYVSMPVINELRNTGSGRLSADRTETGEFEMTNTGSGQIMIDSVFSSIISLKNTGSGKLNMIGSYVDDISITQTGSGSLDAGSIFSPSLISVNQTSSGKVFASVNDGIEIEARLSGSGSIELWGNVLNALFTLSASGRIDAIELMAQDVIANISGSGKIYTYATEFLDVLITASGDVIYRGKPLLSIRITGSGSVRPY
jgi:hypothetical protein